MAMPRSLQQQRIDPFACLIEPLLRDLVFQHLSALDVLNAFAVSKDFNETAMTSSRAMSMIKLRVYPYWKNTSTEDLSLLIKSRRRYKFAEILVDDKFDFDRTILLLKKLSPNLEELKLDFDLTFPHQFPVDMSFPLLKRLTVNYWNFVEARNVIALTSEHLQELSLYGTGDFFNFPIPAIKGKLTSIKYVAKWRLNDQQRHNFKNFLLTTSTTLQKLEINKCSLDNFEFILTKLPALKVLEVFNFDFEKAPEHLENETITTLYIWDSPINTLKCMKNLETIIACSEEPFVEVLREAKHAEKLKTIVVGGLTDHSLTIYLDMMKDDPTVLRGIELLFQDDTDY